MKLIDIGREKVGKILGWFLNNSIHIPLMEHEIHHRLRKYVMESLHLDKQIIHEGQRYVETICKRCGHTGYDNVSKIRRCIHSYNQRHDTFTIVCRKCMNEKRDVIECDF